ncbi:MAG: multiheme c-type cytochrome, partial [Deltaproteobacteria bacterium]|nr:multiheme c-type cytochrome [Deltaproteobacteria bacterium]
GGLARIATLVKAVRAETDALILVDAGERLFQEADLVEVMADQWRTKADFVQKAYGALGVAVVNLGADDLAAGSALALEGSRGIGAVPISANLFEKEANRKTLTQAATILEAGGVRVAFLGIADPASLGEEAAGLLRAEEPLNRVRVTVAELQAEADVVILLSTLPLASNRALAAKVAGLDLVIGAVGSGEGENVVVPERAGNSLVVQVKPLGEFVGRIDLTLPPRGAKSEEGFQDVTPEDPIWGMPPEGGAPGGGISFGDDLDLRGAPARESARSVPPVPPPAPGTIRHTVYAIGSPLVEDAGIQRLMNEYKLKVAEMNRNAPVTAERIPTDGPAYAGAEACKSCHAPVHEFVGTLAHARAYATLEKRNSQFDLECVGCHVTGWDKPGGFNHPAAVGNLKDVQCEACHGPGSVHIASGGARGVGNMHAEVPRETCLGCHTPEHSTRFAPEEKVYLERIRCSQAILTGLTDSAAKPPSTPE